MKRYIKALFATLILSATLLSAVSASAAEKAVGAKLGYNTRSEAPVAGVWFQCPVGNLLRVSPDACYYFRHDNVDAVALNLDVQFPIPLAKGSRVAFYPFAGLNYTSWNTHQPRKLAELNGSDDVTSRINRFGINGGAGIEMKLTSTLKIAIEAKTAVIKSYTSGAVTASIGYCF